MIGTRTFDGNGVEREDVRHCQSPESRMPLNSVDADIQKSEEMPMATTTLAGASPGLGPV